MSERHWIKHSGKEYGYTGILKHGKRHFCQVFFMYHMFQIQTNIILLHAKPSRQETFYTVCGEIERGVVCLLRASICTWGYAKLRGTELSENLWDSARKIR